MRNRCQGYRPDTGYAGLPGGAVCRGFTLGTLFTRTVVARVTILVPCRAELSAPCVCVLACFWNSAITIRGDYTQMLIFRICICKWLQHPGCKKNASWTSMSASWLIDVDSDLAALGWMQRLSMQVERAFTRAGCARARDNRDITVPTGTPRSTATSW